MGTKSKSLGISIAKGFRALEGSKGVKVSRTQAPGRFWYPSNATKTIEMWGGPDQPSTRTWRDRDA